MIDKLLIFTIAFTSIFLFDQLCFEIQRAEAEIELLAVRK